MLTRWDQYDDTNFSHQGSAVATGQGSTPDKRHLPNSAPETCFLAANGPKHKAFSAKSSTQHLVPCHAFGRPVGVQTGHMKQERREVICNLYACWYKVLSLVCSVSYLLHVQHHAHVLHV